MGPELAQYSFYDYFKHVSIVSNKTDKGILFVKDHLQFLSITQQLFNISPYKTFVAPVELLSTNKAVENAI